jgi:hypothetical protein
MSYNLNDIEKALNWGQKNPDATLDDYLESESKLITKKELKYFKDFTYDKVILDLNNEEYEFIVFHNVVSYLNLEKLPKRIAGNKGYYLLTPMPGCWYDGIAVLHIPKKGQESFFTISDWSEFKDNKGLHVIGNEKLQFSFILDVKGDDDGYIFSRNRSIIDNFNNKNIKLWDNQSELHAYVNVNLLNFKPIDELFEIID